MNKGFIDFMGFTPFAIKKTLQKLDFVKNRISRGLIFAHLFLSESMGLIFGCAVRVEIKPTRNVYVVRCSESTMLWKITGNIDCARVELYFKGNWADFQ